MSTGPSQVPLSMKPGQDPGPGGSWPTTTVGARWAGKGTGVQGGPVLGAAGALQGLWAHTHAAATVSGTVSAAPEPGARARNATADGGAQLSAGDERLGAADAVGDFSAAVGGGGAGAVRRGGGRDAAVGGGGTGGWRESCLVPGPLSDRLIGARWAARSLCPAPVATPRRQPSEPRSGRGGGRRRPGPAAARLDALRRNLCARVWG